MKRYEVLGRPLDHSPVTNRAVGDIVRLNLTDDDERTLIAHGAIRSLPDPKPEPKPDLGKAEKA